MRITLISALVGLATMGVAVESCQAARIPIVYGSGERIERLADLPKDLPPPPQLGPGSAIGFKYKFYHLFWCSAWTSTGEYVVFNGDSYLVLKKSDVGGPPSTLSEDAEWISQTFEIPRGQLNRPFFYTFPFGLVLLGSGAIVLFLVSYFDLMPKDFDVAQLLQEARYQQAVEAALKEWDPEEGIKKAVEHLTASGVSAKDARVSMKKVMAALRWAYTPTIKDRALIPAIPAQELEGIMREEVVQRAVGIARSHSPIDEAGVTAAGLFLVSRGFHPDPALTLIWNVLHPATAERSEVEPQIGETSAAETGQ